MSTRSWSLAAPVLCLIACSRISSLDAPGANFVRAWRLAALRSDGAAYSVPRISFASRDGPRLRHRWKTSAAQNQRLSIDDEGTTITLTAALLRPAVALMADSVLISGPFAICLQQGGRLGCVGAGRCETCADSASITHDPERLHWIRFDAPVAALSGNSVGACALLTSGRTAC